MPDLTVEQIANKAYGTYEQAGQVLAKAEEYIRAALEGATSWWGSTLPGDGTRRAALTEIQALEQRLGANSYPEQSCPDWDQARNLLFRARSEYAAVGEGNARSVDNLVHLGADLVQGAKDTAKDVAEGVGTALGAAGDAAGSALGGLLSGLGLTGVLLLGAVGIGGYLYLRKGT